MAAPKKHPDELRERRCACTGSLTPVPRQTGVPELERLATTVENWWPQILAFLHTGITNAGSEGTTGHQDRRPRRLRLPQRQQPALTHPLRHHQKESRTP